MPFKLTPEVIRTLNRRIEAGELKLVSRDGRSKAWEIFSEVVNAVTGQREEHGVAQCNSCKKFFSFDQKITGTSSLTRHNCPKLKHPSSVASVSGSASTMTMRGFLRVPLSVAKRNSAKRNVTKACGNMCCSDLRPFEVANGRGFTEVAQTFINIGVEHGSVDAADVIPNPRTISRYVEGEACRQRAIFIPTFKKLVTEKLIAATTDMWTDDYKKRSFTTITVHWLTDEWELKNRVLCTCAFPLEESKTAVNVLTELKTRFEAFGIPNSDLDKITFVTDQGTNILAALHEHNRLNCSAHLINTILRNTFNKEWLEENLAPVQNTLKECKALVTYLKHSGLSNNLDSAVQQEVETRWNSRLQMLESVLRNIGKIRQVLTERNELQRVINIDQGILEALIIFLKPFKKVSGTLESNFCTIPLVAPWIYRLKDSLKANRGESKTTKMLKKRAMTFLETKFVLTNTHKIATFLHPAYKKLLVVPDEADRLIIFDEVRALIDEEPDNSVPRQAEQAPKRPRVETGDELEIESLIDFAQTPVIAPHAEIDEVSRYLDLPPEETSELDILAWWKFQGRRFPRLSKLARRILNIPASSASSERNFSSAGSVISERRTRLRPKMLDAILYLHNNDLSSDIVPSDDEDERVEEELDLDEAATLTPETL